MRGDRRASSCSKARGPGFGAINGNSAAAARRTGELIELLQTMVRGITADGLTGRGYHAVDDLDLREWLAGHGASQAAIDSPLVHGFYDLSFAYEDGDPGRPRFPAGLALHLALRMFLDYKGALFWKMRAGMGDVVFAPLYEALRRRGVRFRFFHRLDHLHLSDDRRTVEAATFGCEEAAGDEYCAAGPGPRTTRLPGSLGPAPAGRRRACDWRRAATTTPSCSPSRSACSRTPAPS